MAEEHKIKLQKSSDQNKDWKNSKATWILDCTDSAGFPEVRIWKIQHPSLQVMILIANN